MPFCFSDRFIVLQVLLHLVIHAVFHQSSPDVIYGKRKWMYHIVGIETIVAKFVEQYFVSREIACLLRVVFAGLINSEEQSGL